MNEYKKIIINSSFLYCNGLLPNGYYVLQFVHTHTHSVILKLRDRTKNKLARESVVGKWTRYNLTRKYSQARISPRTRNLKETRSGDVFNDLFTKHTTFVVYFYFEPYNIIICFFSLYEHTTVFNSRWMLIVSKV